MSIFGKSNDKVYLLIDIGSGSLTSSFVLYKKKDIPLFLHTITKDFVVTDKPNSTSLFESMAKTLDETLEEMVREGRSHKYWKGNNTEISGAVISFSSPWFMPKTKHIEITKEKPFIVSQKFVDDLIKQEEILFEEDTNKSTNTNDQFEVIEKSIVHMKINGYVLKNYIGHKTSTFDAFLCMSIISKGVITKIYDTILKHTHIPKESILSHTFPIVSFSILRDLYPNYSNFLIVDTTSEVTDLTLIDNDVISQASSFPSGTNFILRQIAKSFSVSTEIAKSTLTLFVEGKLDKEVSTKMELVINDVEKEWSIYFEKALEELSNGKNLPSRVYITSENEVSSIYKTFLKLPKADTTSTFRKNADIVYIENKFFAQLYKNDSITAPNEFIVMLTVFYDKLFKMK